jgi:hypothetical protein
MSRSPGTGQLLGVLSRAAPELRFPEDAVLPIAADATIVVRTLLSRDESVSDAPVLKPLLGYLAANVGAQATAVRFEHIEATPEKPSAFRMEVGTRLRGVIPTGDPTIEGSSLARGSGCLVHIPHWEPQFAELYRFSAPRGIPLTPSDWLRLSCQRRESTAKPARASCGYWLLLE